MEQLRALVIENRSIASGYWELRFSWDSSAAPLPGQFVTVRIAERPAPLLRRPFAISSFDPERREAGIIYQERGGGTRELAGYHQGDRLDLLAPLGHPFPQPPAGTQPVLVAGGVGMGPILFLADALAASGQPGTLVLGAASRAQLPQIELPPQLRYLPCTEDGSAGFAGTSVDQVVELLDSEESRDRVIYTCGPEAMMKRLTELAVARGITIWVSMEQTMGCAVGACLGCAVRVIGEEPYARVCTEGPVFDGRTILWT
ncbi:MAG: dihydroorotate dehydrogenase electron transfer subunit [Spirochaetaceae bacterium]